MARIVTPHRHNSGIPLGGIGTGSVEVRPDGHFHEWQLFNLGIWAPAQPDCCAKAPQPEMPTHALSFFVRTQARGREPVVRHLGARPDFNNPFSAPWMKTVEAVEFDGRYPVVGLRYQDPTLPLDIRAKVFSPFVPHDSRLSGTPGFYTVFTVRNTSKVKQSVSLLGMLKNPVAWGEADRKLYNERSDEGGFTCVTMRTHLADTPAAGSMAFAVGGQNRTCIVGDYEKYFHGYVPMSQGVARPHEVVFHHWRQDGRLVDAAVGTPPTAALGLTAAEIDALSPQARRELLGALRGRAFVEGIVRQISAVHPDWEGTDAGVSLLLHNVVCHLDALAGKARDREWGRAALCSTVELAPGASCEVPFIVAWHFPNHFSRHGERIGHRYEEWFADARAVSVFLAANIETNSRRTQQFARTLYDTSADWRVAEAWAGQLSTMVKSTWWSRDGAFGVWEGLGCCGHHTTDVGYYSSFAITALFPDLELAQMSLGARFQRDDGRVHHMFSPDFKHVDNQYDRVDMNQQFVLMVCRDYLWTADRAFLEAMWPHVIRAMDNTALLDGDGDGLPDRDTARNTYDDWHFSGTPAYVAGLWVSVLLAAARLAEEMGDAPRCEAWRRLHAQAKASFDKLLWNGSYYSLYVDGPRRDECCMTDQISGEWFATLSGIGRSLPAAHVRTALRSIIRHNFGNERGLVNSNYPSGATPNPTTYNNFQATATWSGIEYAFASQLLENGLVDEGLAIVHAVHQRQDRCGRLWDHMECGDHYYRAMSSWAVLLSLSGFKLDMPAGAVAFTPPAGKRPLRAPWFAPGGWGVFSLSGTRLEVRCVAGDVQWRTIRVGLGAKRASVAVNRTRVAAVCRHAGGVLSVQVDPAITLRAGDVLRVSVT